MAERILVVEDDPRMADLLRRGLIFEGYQVDQAGDGETALQTIRNELPDLVVLETGTLPVVGQGRSRALPKKPGFFCANWYHLNRLGKTSEVLWTVSPF